MTTTITTTGTAPTTPTWTVPNLLLRSLDASWNRARWEQLPADGNRYEVIDGVLYLSTAPSFFHQWITRQIALTLIRQLDEAGLGVTAWAPIGLFMPGCDPGQPDLVFVGADQLEIIHDRRIFGVPALLIEILSPTNPEHATTTKRQAYARAEVPEYWIVRPASRDLLVCWQPESTLGDYTQSQLIGPEAEVVSPTLPLRARVADFFAGAPDTTL